MKFYSHKVKPGEWALVFLLDSTKGMKHILGVTFFKWSLSVEFGKGCSYDWD